MMKEAAAAAAAAVWIPRDDDDDDDGYDHDVFQIKTGDRRSMTKIIPTNRKLIAPAPC
jgi:hypothetical protein